MYELQKVTYVSLLYGAATIVSVISFIGLITYLASVLDGNMCKNIADTDTLYAYFCVIHVYE